MTPEIVDLALGALVEAVAGLAEKKSIRLGPEEHEAMARVVLDQLHPSEILGLTLLRGDAIARAANTISQTLDILVVARATMDRARRRGLGDVSTAAAIAAAARALDGFIANDGAAPACFLWPDRGASAPGPLPVLRMKSGSVRARAMLGAALGPMAGAQANADGWPDGGAS